MYYNNRRVILFILLSFVSLIFHLIKSERFYSNDSIRASQMRSNLRLPRDIFIFKSLTEHFGSFRNQSETHFSVFIELNQGKKTHKHDYNLNFTDELKLLREKNF